MIERITIQVVREDGCEDLPLPRYMSEGASGMDVYAAVEKPVEIEPGGTALIPTGLRFSIPTGYEVQVRPRSGLAARNGIMILNAPGTIDSDYRGQIKIILGNLGKEPFIVERGMRIAQLVVQRVIHADLCEVHELDDTERSEGGFGHTGHGP